MTDYQISLPEDLYSALVKAAESSGIKPEDWIAARLPESIQEESTSMTLEQRLGDLIGAINSQQEPRQPDETTSFGEGVVSKLAGQGIYLPHAR